MVPPISRGDAEGSDADTDGDGAADGFVVEIDIVAGPPAVLQP